MRLRIARTVLKAGQVQCRGACNTAPSCSSSGQRGILHNRLIASNYRKLSTTRCSASEGSREIEPPNIRELARMAQISVTDEEVKEWEPKLQQIVSWFGQLQAVDVEGVAPAVRADVGEDNVLRPDIPVKYDAREALLSQVPDKEGGFVKVPKII